MQKHSKTIKRAKSLRQSQTEAEGLLWSVLRSKQLCGLKFRRQHPIGPFFADFACEDRKLVVELDGDYHDHVVEDDLSRATFIENQGWQVIRFSNDDVLADVESVARTIANSLGLPYSFRKRTTKRSGIKSQHAPNNQRDN